MLNQPTSFNVISSLVISSSAVVVRTASGTREVLRLVRACSVTAMPFESSMLTAADILNLEPGTSLNEFLLRVPSPLPDPPTESTNWFMRMLLEADFGILFELLRFSSESSKGLLSDWFSASSYVPKAGSGCDFWASWGCLDPESRARSEELATFLKRFEDDTLGMTATGSAAGGAFPTADGTLLLASSLTSSMGM